MTDTEPWLTDLRSETARHLTRISRLQDDLREVYGEAPAAHGRVLVRVNAAGRPTAITLAPAATSLPPADLAAAILEAVDEAATRAGERLAALVATVVPADQLDSLVAGLTGRTSDGERVAVRHELEELGGEVTPARGSAPSAAS